LTTDDLPLFGYRIRDIYDDTQQRMVPSFKNDFSTVHLLTTFLVSLLSEGSERQEIITIFVNLNKFEATLMRTHHPTFASFDFWAIVVMREALESLEFNLEIQLPEALIPAAVAWVSILGPEMYSWDYEFPYGVNLSDRGRGGPLWNGQHGFCKERWTLWKQRFTELSSSSELSEDLRKLAAEGATKMGEAET